MRKIAGVNLKTSGIEACLADAGFFAFKPLAYEDLRLPADKTARDEALAAFLRKWKTERGLSGVILGLPLQSFSFQLLDMPSMGKQDMRSALMFELEKYLPLPVDEYYLDFICGKSEAGRSRTAVFAVRKEVCDGISGLMHETGVPILAVRPALLAVIRGLAEQQGTKGLNGVLVHAAGDTVELAGLRDSVPVYLKSMPAGADLPGQLERLAVQYPGSLFFSGMDESISGGRAVPVKVHVRIPQLLAASAVKKSRFDIDMLPAVASENRHDYLPKVIFGAAAAAVVLYLASGLVSYYRDYSALGAVEAQRAAIKKRASSLLATRKKIDLLSSDKGTLADFRARSSVAVRALGSLSAVIPKDAWLVSLSADEKGGIEVEGFSSRTSAVIMALEKSGLFRNISYTAPVVTKDGEERFALKMELSGSDK